MGFNYQQLEDEVDEILERTRASRYSAVIVGTLVGLFLAVLIAALFT